MIFDFSPLGSTNSFTQGPRIRTVLFFYNKIFFVLFVFLFTIPSPSMSASVSPGRAAAGSATRVDTKVVFREIRN